MVDDDPTEAARAIRVAVGRLSRQLRKLYSQGRPDAEPSFLELALLLRLTRMGGSTVGELANDERVTGQAVSAAVTALQRRELVNVRPDERDRRRAVVAINDRGRAQLASREQRIGDRLTQVVAADLTPRERALLMRAAPLLDRLADLL